MCDSDDDIFWREFQEDNRPVVTEQWALKYLQKHTADIVIRILKISFPLTNRPEPSEQTREKVQEQDDIRPLADDPTEDA